MLDTCAVIWTFEGERISASARAMIAQAADANTLFVSAVTAWELGLLASPDRRVPLELGAPPERAFEAVIALAGVAYLPLEYRPAILSSALPGRLHNDPADRLLIATARDRDLTLVTRDKAILDYARLGHVKAVRC